MNVEDLFKTVNQSDSSEDVQHYPSVGADSSKYSGFVHFDVKDGKIMIVDGEQYNKDTMIESLRTCIKNGYSWTSGAERNSFIIKVCRAFGMPTDVVNRILIEPDQVLNLAQVSPNLLNEGEFEVESTSFQKFGESMRQSDNDADTEGSEDDDQES